MQKKKKTQIVASKIPKFHVRKINWSSRTNKNYNWKGYKKNMLLTISN